jgi:hypothetical protein
VDTSMGQLMAMLCKISASPHQATRITPTHTIFPGIGSTNFRRLWFLLTDLMCQAAPPKRYPSVGETAQSRL